MCGEEIFTTEGIAPRSREEPLGGARYGFFPACDCGRSDGAGLIFTTEGTENTEEVWGRHRISRYLCIGALSHRTGLQHKTANPLFQERDVEVDQQTGGKTAQTHVRENLCFVDWREDFNRLDFEQNTSLYDEIQSIATFEVRVLIHDWQGHLAAEGNTAQRQFVSEAVLVRRFQQSRPKLPVNLDRRVEDRPGQSVASWHRAILTDSSLVLSGVKA